MGDITKPQTTDGELLYNLAAFIVDYEFQAPMAKYSSRQELVAKYTQMITAYVAQRDQQRLSALEREISRNIPPVPKFSSDEMIQLRYKGGYLAATTDMLMVCKSAITATLAPDTTNGVEEKE